MNKKILFYYWIAKSFLQKHRIALILASVAGALSFAVIPLLFRYVPQQKPNRYVARVGDYSLANLPRDIQLKVSAGLTSIDDSGKPQPNLSTHWQVLDDGKTYVFKLSDKAIWQDGESIKSHEIEYTINDVEISYPDDTTIVFRLKEPFVPFPTIVSQPIFKRVQRKYLQVFNRTKIIGTGEYTLKKLKFKGNILESIVLESQSEKLIYRFYSTEQAAILAFKLAEVDEIEGVSSPGELAQWSGLTIEKTVNYHDYLVIFFNTEDGNLKDKSIRQALAYMTPKSEDTNTRALGPLSPESWAYNPNVKPYNYSYENATQLMSKFSPFDLELTTTPSFFAIADQVKASWEQLGLKVTVKVVSVPDVSNFQALLIGQRIPYDPDQYILWHSTQDSNLTNYNSPKVDKLLEDARKEMNEDKRKDAYLNFQRFLLEDSPAAFLHYLPTYTIKR